MIDATSVLIDTNNRSKDCFKLKSIRSRLSTSFGYIRYQNATELHYLKLKCGFIIFCLFVNESKLCSSCHIKYFGHEGLVNLSLEMVGS